ncbi:hypothetical protein BDI4_590064 [Burkholderia diffusa]|nr:hypothetical protein BDI4_590064 [Burkholderia diffusa]
MDLGNRVPCCGKWGLWIWGTRSLLWDFGPKTPQVTFYGGNLLVPIYGASLLIRLWWRAQHFMWGCRLWDGFQVVVYGCRRGQNDLVLLVPSELGSHKQYQAGGKVTFCGEIPR